MGAADPVNGRRAGRPDRGVRTGADRRARPGSPRESTWVDRAGVTVAAAVLLLAFWWVAGLFSDGLDAPLPPCTATSTSVCSGPPVDHTDNGAGKDSLPPCPTEDSPGCVWDASEQGNGQGHDVVNPPIETP